MPNFNEFDLDVKLGTSNGTDDGDKITSIKFCSAGTCNNTCSGDSTLNSNCCLGSAICSLAAGCR